ncbi:MAG: hypothetical protein Q4B84_05510, partial [Clostridia bacterium]|nr:hypothetical protein [Clostridia bacterium]
YVRCFWYTDCVIDEKEEYSKFYGSSLAFRFLEILDCTKIELYKIKLFERFTILNFLYMKAGSTSTL